MDATQQLDAVLEQARAKEQSGDLRGAGSVLDGAPKPQQQTGAWCYARGAVALRLGDVPRAVKHFEEAVGREPEVAEYRANLGAALLEQAKAGQGEALTRALAELTEATRWGGTLPSVQNNLGMAHLLKGDTAKALACFDAALQVDARHVPTLYNRAAALNAAGRLEDALAALDAVLKVAPDFEPARTSRANTLKKLGR
jgi:tetratricopeptide (TPR) repeat protein